MKFSASEDNFDNVSIVSCGTTVASSERSFAPKPTGLPANYKDIKSDIRAISEPSKLKCYMLEHDAELSQYSTALLNSWLSIEGHKFYKSRGALLLKKVSETRYKSLQQLTDEVAELKNSMTELREQFDELCKMVYPRLR
jgi:chaperonin cofactor prefoldin